MSSLLFQIFKQYHRMNPQQLQQRFHAVYLKYVEMRKKMQDYYKSNAPKEAEVQKDYVKWVEWSRFIIYFIYSFDLFYLPIYFKEQRANVREKKLRAFGKAHGSYPTLRY